MSGGAMSGGDAARSGLAGQSDVGGSGGTTGGSAAAGNMSSSIGGASGTAASVDGGAAGVARAAAGNGGQAMLGNAGVGGGPQTCTGSVNCTGEIPASVDAIVPSFPYGKPCSHDGDYCSGSLHTDLTNCLPWFALCCSGTWAQLSSSSANGVPTCPSTGAGGAAGQGGGGGNAGQPAVACTGSLPYFPDFERSCASDADCVAAIHQTDCCGSEAAFGIRASELPAFNTAEATCEQQYPACGCAASGIDVENGARVDVASRSQIAGRCDAGACKAHYLGPSFACGNIRCVQNQYCEQSSGGPSGTSTSYSCTPSGCTDCSCLTMPNCTCSDDSGQLTLTCQFS